MVAGTVAERRGEEASAAADFKASVVVCTHNRARLLPMCMDFLSRQTFPREQFEIILVDNASTDETAAVAAGLQERMPHLRVIREPRAGKSFALNTGIRVARGQIVAFLDDDGRAAPDWLERIVAAFEHESPTPAAVGGDLDPIFSISPPRWFPPGHFAPRRAVVRGFLSADQARSGLSGCNMAVRRDLLIAVGGFDPTMGPRGRRFSFGEDTEIFRRLVEHSPHVWYDPAIHVEHLVPAERLRVADALKRAYLHGRAVSSLEGVWGAQLMVGRHRRFVPYLRRLLGKLSGRSGGVTEGAPKEAPGTVDPHARPLGRGDRLKRELFVASLSIAYELGRLRGARWRRGAERSPDNR